MGRFERFLFNCRLLPIYIVAICTYAQGAYMKWTGSTIGTFEKTFAHTLFMSLPAGIVGPYYIIAALESAVVLMLFYSLIRLEFYRPVKKHMLRLGLEIQMYLLAVLYFGNLVTNNYAEQGGLLVWLIFTMVAFIFTYFFERKQLIMCQKMQEDELHL